MSGVRKGSDLRIYLVRHGESEANINKDIYRTKPDHAMNLTERGKQMAEGAGAFFKEEFRSLFGSKAELDKQNHHIRMWVSPFTRTRETAEGILKVLNVSQGDFWVDSVRESALLVEQDFGMLESQGSKANHGSAPIGETVPYYNEQQRNHLKQKYSGQFWERPPNGESSFDVCGRLSSLIGMLLEDVNVPDSERAPIRTVIIISHGSAIKTFIQTWCRFSPEWFHVAPSATNCSVQRITNSTYDGFCFSGFEKGSLVRTLVEKLPLVEDPRSQFWNPYLKPKGPK